MPTRNRDKPVQLVVSSRYCCAIPCRARDSTDLKIFGEGAWLEEKHKTEAKRKSWCKLHLGLDLVSGAIFGSDLTTDDVGDPTALPELLDQIDSRVSHFLAEGAHDGKPTSDLLAERFGSTLEVTIPPPKTAIPSPNAVKDPTARDRHIAEIAPRGRIAWQKSTVYNQGSRGETLMSRWKTIIEPKLKVRSFENQKTEARIGVRILNRMPRLGRPDFERVA